jgi:hypothetical protein
VLGKKYSKLEQGQLTVVMSHGLPKGDALKFEKKSQEDKQEKADDNQPRFKSLQDFKNDSSSNALIFGGGAATRDREDKKNE